MNLRSLIIAVALAFVVSSSTRADTVSVSQAFLDRLIQEARASHPTMQAAQARTEAATAAIGAVRLWEDPQLGLGLTAARRSMRKDDGDVQIGVEQMLPRRGLYDAMKRQAVAQQQVLSATGKQTALTLGVAVSQAVLELALADDVIVLQTENLEWLRTIVKTAAERAKNPDANAAESLRLESELALRTQSLAVMVRQREQFTASLNVLLGRHADAAWPALALTDASLELASASALKAQLEHSNPQLAAMRHQVTGAQAEADAAREKRKPIFSLGVQTDSYSGGDFRDAMFALKVTLPWLHRAAYDADIARADKLHVAAQNDLAAQQRELYMQVLKLDTEARNSQQTVQSYTRDVLPKAEQAVTALQNAWVSSKATLLEVLDARRTLLEARQEQKRALAAGQVAAQALTAITGKSTP